MKGKSRSRTGVVHAASSDANGTTICTAKLCSNQTETSRDCGPVICRLFSVLVDMRCLNPWIGTHPATRELTRFAPATVDPAVLERVFAYSTQASVAIAYTFRDHF